MSHSPALRLLLFDIRQHAAFDEFKRAVEAPRLPRYRPKQADTMETMGARTIFASGEIAQHERWLMFLTGQPETSEQERS